MAQMSFMGFPLPVPDKRKGGGGKASANGTATSSGTGILTVTGLSFTPSYVLARTKTGPADTAGYSAYGNFASLGATSLLNGRVLETGATGSASFTAVAGGFTIQIDTNKVCVWIAFE